MSTLHGTPELWLRFKLKSLFCPHKSVSLGSASTQGPGSQTPLGELGQSQSPTVTGVQALSFCSLDAAQVTDPSQKVFPVQYGCIEWLRGPGAATVNPGLQCIVEAQAQAWKHWVHKPECPRTGLSVLCRHSLGTWVPKSNWLSKRLGHFNGSQVPWHFWKSH